MGPATAIPKSPREVFEMFFSDDLMKLIVELEEDGVYAYGTARNDHKGFSEQLKKVTLKNRYTK